MTLIRDSDGRWHAAWTDRVGGRLRSVCGYLDIDAVAHPHRDGDADEITCEVCRGSSCQTCRQAFLDNSPAGRAE